MKRRSLALAGFAVVVGLLAGCGRKEAPPAPSQQPVADAAPAEAHELKVLATSDLSDVKPLQEMVQKATGVQLKFRFGGTMESTEAVLSGQSEADVAWFANAKYLLSDAQGQGRVKLQEKIMLSPLAVGVSQSAAAQLGWADPAQAAKITWKDITDAARTGRLNYALSNPATSNQGFMALMGVVAAASQ